MKSTKFLENPVATSSWQSAVTYSLLIACLALQLGGGCARTPQPSTTNEGSLQSEKQFRDKLAELRMQLDKSNRAIARLEQEKSEAVELLKSKGITSSADLENNSEMKYVAKRLKACRDDLEKFQNERSYYHEAITAIEAMLAEIERKNIHDAAALSEEEYLSLRKIVLDLNDRLKVDEQDLLEDEAIDSLLKEELGSKK